MELTLEQKIVLQLARKGYLTKVGEVTTALNDPQYANKIISGDTGGIPETNEECDHTSLTNEEIQEVFDNDEETK